MIRGQDLVYDRFYEPAHIAAVWADMQNLVGLYFQHFAPTKISLKKHMLEALETFEGEQPLYQKLMDSESLEEFAYDPGAFKGTLRRECPIIRRCLNAPAQVMDAYRKSFNQTSGDRLLTVVTNLSKFASEFMPNFQSNLHLRARAPDELGISVLDTEPYSAYGSIGGGIRSHLLFNLHPDAFPNRSQNAVWSYYFLTSKKDYGFEDCSEFLMVNPDGSGTQQNYFYPYDLFSFYASKLVQLLETSCDSLGYTFSSQYRYIYLDRFLDHIADFHRNDIDTLKPPYEQFDY